MAVCKTLREQLQPTSVRTSRLVRKAYRFLKSNDGPTAVEYAVMLALIIVVCLAAVTSVGTQAAAKFNTIATQVGKAGS